MPPALIDLDAAPVVRQRPGRRRLPGRPAVALLALVLAALLGASAPPRPDRLPATVIAAQSVDSVFVHGDRMWIVDATSTGRPRSMQTYRLPDATLLARTTLKIPEPVAAILPVGDVTLIATTVGRRPAVVAMDDATGRSRWWQFGVVRAASAGSGLLLLSDSDVSQDIDAVDLRSGAFRWQVPAPAGGSLEVVGEAAGVPRWLVAFDPLGRLDTYDGQTGKHLASAPIPGYEQLAGAAGGLYLVGGQWTGVTAYALPALTVRWQQVEGETGLVGPTLAPDCGGLICVFGPTLTALDPATGRIRWSSSRWTFAQRAGDYLVASETAGTPDLVPLTVLDPATGRARADLGGWREIPGQDSPVGYVVYPGHPALFGRFDPGRAAVRLLGTTDREFRRCDAGTGAIACQLTGGPVAIFRLGGR